MKRTKQVLSLALAATTGLSLVACGGSKPADTSATTGSTLERDEAKVYNEVLGDFYDVYMNAKSEDVKTVSERYALMAIAEAKLLESGTFLPIYSNGGSYSINRTVPYTVDYALWGNDEYRYHNALVTTDLIKKEDYEALRAKWREITADEAQVGKGTYVAYAKEYLTGKGYTFSDTFNWPYSDNVQTWDCLATSKAVDTKAIINTFDGLMEYDNEGVLQPALATGFEVSEDGLTYTFTLRDAVWTDNQGRKVADVTGDDFVAGMQHLLDAKGGLESLLFGIVENADKYVSGECTFEEVGVKADGNKVTYKLAAPCSYFTTMLGYSLFAPMNRAFYEQHGGKFGADFDSSASDYTYGSSIENIAYCGPYLATSYVKDQSIVFAANASYWNASGINMKTINWKFNDGTIATKAFEDAVAGEINGCGLNPATVVSAKELKNAEGVSYFDAYGYTSLTDATTFCGFTNVNRQAFANFNDATVGVTTKSEDEQERTLRALRNKNFRLGLLQAFDRASMNAQVAGDDLKLVALRNSYTPGNFVKLAEDTKVDINGKETEFKAGTFYGEIMQAQLDADKVEIKVWDEKELTSDGFDGWFNPKAAQASLAKAVEELKKDGVTVDKDHPIIVELPTNGSSEVYVNKGNAIKQSIESASEGLISFVLVDCVNREGLSYAGYLTEAGKDANYDLYDQGGWGPDYGDPSSYLDTMLPDGDGYMCKSIGLF